MQPLITQKLADTDHEIHDFLAARWSPRVFSDKSISNEAVGRLFEAARWAASSNNWQPWRFIYAHRGSDAYDKIVDCLAEFNQGWAGNAPLLVVSIMDKSRPDGKENFHALHDLGLAVGNLTMQAQSEGIAVHQMAGIDFEKTKKVFEIPEQCHVATALAIGYYGGQVGDLPESLQAGETKKRERKPLSEITGNGKFPG